MTNRILSILLAACLLLSLLPAGVAAAEPAGEVTPQVHAPSDYDVLFLSDLHNGVGGYHGLKQMMAELQAEGLSPRVISHGGDYVEDSKGGQPNWQTQVYDVISGTERSAFPLATQVYTMGNHDFESGTLGGASGQSAKEAAFKKMFGYDRTGKVYEDDELVIYTIGAQGETGGGGGGEAFLQADIDAFAAFLQTMAGSRKAVFLQTHWPAHSGYNFKQRTVGNADKLIDLCNQYAADLDIVWIWGHNHYEDQQRYVIEPPGGRILYAADASGSSWGNPKNPQYKQIQFTYANAGCMNDMWWKHTGGNNCSTSDNWRGPSACLSVAVTDSTIEFQYNRIRRNSDGTFESMTHDANLTIYNHNITMNHPAQVTVARAHGGPPCEHDDAIVNVVAPTCTEAGYTERTCTLCGRTVRDTPTEALGHDYLDGICTRCGARDPHPPVQPGEAGYYLAATIEAGKTYVIVADAAYAMTSDTVTYQDSGTKNGRAAVPVAVASGRITSEVTDAMCWTFAASTAPAAYNGAAQYLITDASGRVLQRGSGSTGTAPIELTTAPSTARYAAWSFESRGDGSYTMYVNTERSSTDYPFQLTLRNASYFNAPSAGRDEWNELAAHGSAITLYEYRAASAEQPPVSATIDFTDPASADRFAILGQRTAAIEPGVGLPLVTTRNSIEPANDRNSGTQANTPEDLVSIPVSGDWTATLTVDFRQNGAANGYYQFFGFYAVQGEDYQNMAGIRGGNGAMQDFLRLDGAITAETQNSAPGFATEGTYYFRIVKVGTTYSCLRSADGVRFEPMFTYADTGIEATRLILDAYTGMTTGYAFTLRALDLAAEAPGCAHDWTCVVTAPTCEADGYTTYTCALCGQTEQRDPTPATGHQPELRGQSAATCTASGYSGDQVCTVCGAVVAKGEAIPASGHRPAVRGHNEPTCTEAGTTGDTVCTACGTILAKGEKIPPLGHEIVERRVEPTCTAPGSLTRTCTRCDQEEATTLPALGHDMVKAAVTAPTCTEPGYTTYRCTRCDHTEQRDPTPATGHQPAVRDRREPTCTEPGATGETVCTVCGEILAQGEAIPALGHDMVKAAVTAPTCTEPGYTTYRCTRCDHTEQRDPTPATGHQPTLRDRREPTCTAPGATGETVCTVCGEILAQGEAIPVLGHEIVERRVEPTCTAPGLLTRACTRCDQEEATTLPALGHDMAKGNVTAPTCTEPGYTTYRCTRCDHTERRDAVEALGHRWDDGVLTLAPTCTAEGKRTITCAACGVSYVVGIAHLEHEPALRGERAPTCAAEGYTGDTACTLCGEVFATGQSIAKLAHHYADGFCTVCGEKECDHVRDEGRYTTEPTCTGNGILTYACTLCGVDVISRVVAPLGHDWDEGTVTRPATATEEGEKTYTCTRCGETKTEPIPPIPDEPKECPSRAFTDVPGEADWSHAGIDYCVENGLMNGTSATLFSPKGTVTRAQLVTILYRIEGEPEVAGPSKFADVPAGQWYTAPIAWAAASGIVNGMSETKFAPMNKITREQIAAILYRYTDGATAEGSLDAFPDAAKVNGWAKDGMVWAVSEGLITGVKNADGTTTLNPAANATRAQIASIIMRYLEAQ